MIKREWDPAPGVGEGKGNSPAWRVGREMENYVSNQRREGEGVKGVNEICCHNVS